MKLIRWVKKLIHITRVFDEVIAKLGGQITNIDHRSSAALSRAESAEKFIRARTDVSVDLGIRGPNTIIVTGRYKNREYVEIFDIQNEDMDQLVEMLRSMKRHHVVRSIDGPYEMKAFISDQLRF